MVWQEETICTKKSWEIVVNELPESLQGKLKQKQTKLVVKFQTTKTNDTAAFVILEKLQQKEHTKAVTLSSIKPAEHNQPTAYYKLSENRLQ